MKTTKRNNLKTRVIAGVLSAVCVFSAGAMSINTAFAAEKTSTSYSQSVNSSTKKDTAEIKEILNKYLVEKSKKEKAKKESAKTEKYITAGINSIINLTKGKYIESVSGIIKMFPYGDAISSVFNFVAGLIMEPEEPDKVPSITLEDIKEQLNSMQETLNSVSADIKLIKNQRFTDSVNNLIRILKASNKKLTMLAKEKVAFSKVAQEIKIAQKSRDRIAIIAAEKEYNEVKENIIQLQSDIRLSKENMSQLRQSLAICMQYMMSMTLDGESDNPFLGYLESKKAGANVGDSMDDIIDICLKRDGKIFTIFNESVLLYSMCEANNISDLLESDKKADIREAAALAEEYVQFVTGFSTTSKGGEITMDETDVDPDNVNDAHDYYMSKILPKEIEKAGTFKYEDNSWDIKAATVTCNGTVKMFANIGDAVSYANNYSNTTIKLFADVKLDSTLEFKSGKSVTIDLNGHTIDAQQKCRAIYSEIKLNITSSSGMGTIKNGYGYIRENGGAIYCYCKELNIEKCKFINNKAKYYGGAVYGRKDTSINNCTFEGNTAKISGGAIFSSREVASSSLSIRNSSFYNNSVELDGGAIGVSDDGVDADIYNTVIKNNYAGKNGGGVWLGSLSTCCHKLNTVTIENNKCGKEGGGIYCDSGFGAGDVNLYRTIIIRNNYRTDGTADNARMYASGKKAVFYVKDNFDIYRSYIGVTSTRNNIPVAEFNSKDAAECGSFAFHADTGRVELGSFFDKTLYWYEKA